MNDHDTNTDDPNADDPELEALQIRLDKARKLVEIGVKATAKWLDACYDIAVDEVVDGKYSRALKLLTLDYLGRADSQLYLPLIKVVFKEIECDSLSRHALLIEACVAIGKRPSVVRVEEGGWGGLIKGYRKIPQGVSLPATSSDETTTNPKPPGKISRTASDALAKPLRLIKSMADSASGVIEDATSTETERTIDELRDAIHKLDAILNDIHTALEEYGVT